MATVRGKIGGGGYLVYSPGGGAPTRLRQFLERERKPRLDDVRI